MHRKEITGVIHMKKTDQLEERYRGFDKRMEGMSLSTQCIHAGEGQKSISSFSATTPLYQAVSYYYENNREMSDLLDGKRAGYSYARWGNPTNAALESALSTLIGGGITLTTASGMAANFLALQAAGAYEGKTLLVSQEIYGNTYDIIKNSFEKFGVRCLYADFKKLDELQHLMKKENPDVVFFEVLTNPMLSVIDAPAIITMAHSVGAKVVIDNTFASPYLYHPFADGVDYEVHSLTKYINGHGDAMGGSITCRAEDFQQLEYLGCTQGAVLSAGNAQLILRGLKTFVLRVRQQNENAKQLAAFLADHPKVSNTRFPGLVNHPAHETAARLFRPGCFGGMVCFDLKDTNRETCFKVIDSLKLALPAGSLGDVFTLALHPASTTHHSLTAEQKHAIGITETTIRVSVGIEEIQDLIADFSQALDQDN
jgi:cystathionine gamma-synthase/methionine-gamma-lyase